MLSADPYVSDPFNTQNYNRYSYVNNNPLSMVDPTGYCPAYNEAGPADQQGCGSLDEIVVSGQHTPKAPDPEPPDLTLTNVSQNLNVNLSQIVGGGIGGGPTQAANPAKTPPLR